MLVQPFVASVVTEGEVSVMAAAGTPTHAVRKRAKAGDWRVQVNFGGTDERIDDGHYRDDILRLLFVCCHPELPATQQIALALRIVCGLSVGQIAKAFLVSESAMPPVTLAFWIEIASTIVCPLVSASTSNKTRMSMLTVAVTLRRLSVVTLPSGARFAEKSSSRFSTPAVRLNTKR